MVDIPCGYVKLAIANEAIVIVSFPMEMLIFHSDVSLPEDIQFQFNGRKGKSTGNHRFSNEIWDFPVFFP